jgi:uncharacterized BrkB/YihY/UPF0761 family membrane protein
MHLHYLHSMWSWYLHLHLPQRVGIGIIAILFGLAGAAFVLVVGFIWLHELIHGGKRGWVPLLVGAILTVVLMAVGVALQYCIIVGFSVLFSMVVLWDIG